MCVFSSFQISCLLLLLQQQQWQWQARHWVFPALLLLLRVDLDHTVVKPPTACQFWWICSFGDKTLGWFCVRAQLTHSSICAGVQDTKELCLLLCFVLGGLSARENHFWTSFGEYSAGKCCMGFPSLLCLKSPSVGCESNLLAVTDHPTGVIPILSAWTRCLVIGLQSDPEASRAWVLLALVWSCNKHLRRGFPVFEC